MANPELAGFYLEQFLALLPPGRIWPQRSESQLQQLFLALSTLLADVHEAILNVYQVELYPPTTVDLLPEWEEMVGLPDPCTPAAQTIQERRARVLQKLTVQPNPTAGYLQAIIEQLGYPGATIVETGPHEFTVTVPNPRATYFRTGSSRCGDLLGAFARADDLECVLEEQKPAHLSIVFNYSGV